MLEAEFHERMLRMTGKQERKKERKESYITVTSVIKVTCHSFKSKRWYYIFPNLCLELQHAKFVTLN